MLISFDRKIAGVLAPLFALRGRCDHGCGDVAALREFIVWAAATGFRCVQLLPVNETGSDHSPYNAISSVAIEPATIALGDIADLQPAELASITEAHGVDTLRSGSVQWPAVKALVRAALRRAFANFRERHWEANDARAKEFSGFVRAESAWLDSYALFRALLARNGSEQWDKWPAPMRSLPAALAWVAELRSGGELAQEIAYFQYVQWIAFTQWRAVKKFADTHGVTLMGDIPFGVSFYSADVWAEPELFDHGWCGGAPPEPAFDGNEFVQRWGQNWGVPLYRWPRHRETEFAWWRRRARKVAEGFHVFRIDHVLGFYRIYGFPWRPERNAEFLPLTPAQARERTGGALPHYIEHDDDTPEHRAANRAQGEELLRALQRETPAMVGEDLGTVPEYVRPSLLALGIPGFRVPQWEQEPGGALIPGDRYDRCSVATYATHDHEPLRAMWTRWMRDIERAHADPERLGPVRESTWREVRRIAAWAGFEVPRILEFEDVHERLLAALFRSESWLAVAMITDVLGTEQRFNVPGSVADANWSARLDAGWQQTFAEKCQRITKLLRETGRCDV
jgi:4-alpha-glucanotransferase